MVSFGDEVELYAWQITADKQDNKYVVIAQTAMEAERCFRVGWSEKWGRTGVAPEVTKLERFGKYLWPR